MNVAPRHIRYAFILCAAALFLQPRLGPCRDSEDGEVLPVPEVEVSGEAPEAHDESERFSLTPVTTEDVEKSPGVNVTTEEILESTPSVRVKQFGSYGSPSLLSVRGSDATHTLVLLDDIPLNDASTGLVDLSTVPSFLLQSVSVFRGVVPSVPSPYHPGGVVKFSTRKPGPGLHAEAYLKGGFFPLQGNGAAGWAAGQEAKPASSILRFGALRQLILSSSALKGSFGILASGGLEQGDGDFVYFNDNGTTYNTADDSFRMRKNNGHTAVGALLSMLYFPDLSSEVKLSFLEFDRSAGVPGLDVIQAGKTRLRSGRQYLSLSYSRFGELADFPSFGAKGYFKSSAAGWMDPLGEISNARHTSESRSLGSGLGLSGARVLSGESTLLWGVGGGVERWDSENVFPEGAPREQHVLRFTAGWNVTEFASLAEGRVELSGSLRSDFIGDQPLGDAAEGRHSNEYFFSPGAGARLKPFRWLSFSFNVSWNHRPATLIELFGDQGVVIGNPGLRSETSLSWDAGAVFDFSSVIPVDAFEIEYRFFDNRVSDLITFIQNSQRTMVAQNIGRASIRGLELILRMQILGMIKMQMGYTFLEPRDRSGIEPYDGRMLPNRPRHDMFLGGSVSRWSVTLGYRMDLLSGGFVDRASLRPIAERAIHSLSVEWEPGLLKGFVLGMELWNAGNLILSEREVSSGDRTYAVREAVSDVDGYPLPGLGVYFCAGFKK